MKDKNPIRIHPKITKWRWYKDANTKSLFFHLIITACQSGCIVKNTFIKKGQCLCSFRELGNETGLSLSQIRRSIKKLAETGEIDVNSRKKFTLITLLNYESYQDGVKAVQTEDISEGNNTMFYNQCLANSVWLETMCMHNNISVDHVKYMLSKFMLHLQTGDDRKKKLSDFTSHFRNWLKYQKKDEDSVPGNEMYVYTWEGMHEIKANYGKYLKDKKAYDHQGFNFKLIKVIKDE